jgi:hypothetical protein
MFRLIKILHIDLDYQVTYFIWGSHLSIKTSIPLQMAIGLLKNQDFNLIVSEPHNKAILKERHPFIKFRPGITDEQLFMRATQGDLREGQSIQYP